VRTLLRHGASDAELEQLLGSLIWRKPWGHGLPDGVIPLERGMSQIGG
jgi:GTP 3',8-cyclase